MFICSFTAAVIYIYTKLYVACLLRNEFVNVNINMNIEILI